MRERRINRPSPCPIYGKVATAQATRAVETEAVTLLLQKHLRYRRTITVTGNVLGEWQEVAVKVLLVNPEFPDTYWSFRHALPFERKRCAFPPLGLLTVSALLPDSWERRLVDLNIESLKTSQLLTVRSWCRCLRLSA